MLVVIGSKVRVDPPLFWGSSCFWCEYSIGRWRCAEEEETGVIEVFFMCLVSQFLVLASCLMVAVIFIGSPQKCATRYPPEKLQSVDDNLS